MEKSNYEYELVKGVYLSNYKTERPNEYRIEVTGNPHNEAFYMSFTDEMDKLIITSESSLREISHKLFSDNEVNPEDFLGYIADMLAYRYAPIEGAKYQKDDGTFIYRIRSCNNMPEVPFLHKQDLSFENPDELEKIKTYAELKWPTFSADQTELARLLETKGYPVEHRGRSGFESRNRYCIELPDIDEEDIINVINKIKQDITDAEHEIELKKLAQADKEFQKNVLDEDGIFSCIDLGGGPSDIHTYDKDKYQEVGKVRTVCCQDSRQNITHIYSVLLYDKEKLEKTDKKVICLSYALGLEYELKRISTERGINFKIGKNEYIIAGRILQNVSHLDLDLNNPEDVKKALIQDSLSWPSINATSKVLKEELEKMGYILEYSGRSGFESRNSYIIKTKDGVLTPEISAQLTKDLEEAKQSVKRLKMVAFDEYFDAQSTDKSKVYAVVETGYDYNLTRVMDEEKYERSAQICTAYTQDYRRGYSHTYQELVFNKERIQEDKRKFIVLEVPKEMIGIIIGKGGNNIKALQQKFGKKFTVVQDPREVEAEKKQAEEERARQHRYDLQTIQNSIKNFIGDSFMSADDDSITISVVEYIINHQNNLPCQPTQEEMLKIKEDLIAEREEEIARENRRKAEEIERQKWLEEQRLAEQKRLEKEKNEEMIKTIKAYIQKVADENNGKVISNEDFIKFTNETYKGDELAQKQMSSVQKDFLLKMEEERAMQKRFAEAEKNFDKVAAEEFIKFFEDDVATGEHGYYFFASVGKARREGAYEAIAKKVAHRLGIDMDLRKSLEERLLDPRSPDERIGYYLYEERKFYNRIVNFNKKEPIINEPQKPSKEEPTMENLAMLWGANLKKLK